MRDVCGFFFLQLIRGLGQFVYMHLQFVTIHCRVTKKCAYLKALTNN